MENEKDMVALQELATIINRLTTIHRGAQQNVGKCRPILSEIELTLIQDHLDLVKKYIRL